MLGARALVLSAALAAMVPAAAVLLGGVYSASAAVTAATPSTDLAPASTSADRAPSCEVRDAPPTAPAAGGTLVSFTLVSPDCLQ